MKCLDKSRHGTNIPMHAQSTHLLIVLECCKAVFLSRSESDSVATIACKSAMVDRRAKTFCVDLLDVLATANEPLLVCTVLSVAAVPEKERQEKTANK